MLTCSSFVPQCVTVKTCLFFIMFPSLIFVGVFCVK